MLILKSEPPEAVQDPKRLEKFLVQAMPPDGPVIYRKYESTNALISDTYHDRKFPWVEQFTDRPPTIADLAPRVLIEDGEKEDGKRGISLSDGLICTYHGTYNRDVSLLPDGTILSEEEADAREELSGRALPKYAEWCFRLVEVVFTDGPERTLRAMETAEQARNRAETKMFDAQNSFFTQMM